MGQHQLDTLAVNTIRFLAADAVQRANSGHPGLPMGAAPAAYVLWTRHLKHAPSSPRWADRDRFVLSAEHGSMLLYAPIEHYAALRAIPELLFIGRVSSPRRTGTRSCRWTSGRASPWRRASHSDGIAGSPRAATCWPSIGSAPRRPATAS